MIERFQHWFEHEVDSNQKMLTMIESVPDDRRGDPAFGRAVTLAAHLAACRENWLARILAGESKGPWWEPDVPLESLPERFRQMEAAWRAFFVRSDDNELVRDFEFTAGDGKRYRWSVEGQLVQLVGHAHYHRGQIALLVDQLGGATVDSDYLYWAYEQDSRYGPIE